MKTDREIWRFDPDQDLGWRRELDRHRRIGGDEPIPALSTRPLLELVRLSRTSIADEMRGEHRASSASAASFVGGRKVADPLRTQSKRNFIFAL
jgi:hypothetical protein